MDADKQQNNRFQEHWMEYILPIILIAGLVALLTIVIDSPVQGYTPLISEEALLATILGYVILVLEIATAYVIASALIRATISYTRHLFDPINRQINYTERIRLRLGHMLNLGLEFAIGSDILRLAVAPSSRDIIILFTKVLLRILLNYFLDREIRASEELCGPGNYIPPMNGDIDENV